ncbi:MAG: nucleotidyltransferase family protein [Prevotella pallens]|mgnify:FL=1|jgi:nucleotidyl transferase|uniref:nucleotidyltransferase family protein n=1 Tax=Prevotella pallens TaxID=60133 RepID=UPI001CB66E78|nr:nucleotidyltransferase family protein [Prevotella pallens]MBF1467525.1 nucleotidyltransferase family protein [Prevotella pallens]MBF1474997.1 nucleotidyltransferase family protein [Prevotella pallens]MBF1506083.1 nucleotidyltransferase family protein [Prevotella pallens]
MQSMIFAAGLGTRLKPLTDRIPKALVRVGGKPLIEYVLKNLVAAGSKRIVVNVHHFANQIIEYLQQNDFGVDIRVSDETEMLLDTGGGIKNAAPFFNTSEPVLIHNVDILSNVDLRALYNYACEAEIEQKVDAVLLVSLRKTKRYLIFNKDMRLVGWTNVDTGEVKSPYETLRELTFTQPYDNNNVTNEQYGYTLFAFSGIHIIGNKVFEAMNECSAKFPIMDFYLQYAKDLHFVGKVKNNLKLMDVGKLDTLAEADAFVKQLGY